MNGGHAHRVGKSISAADAPQALLLLLLVFAHQPLHEALGLVLDPAVNVGIVAIGVVDQMALDMANLLAKTLVLDVELVVARLQALLDLLELVDLFLLLLAAL